jgi:N-acetylglucosamine kinase-like BadF-type ATPase
MSYVVGVDVGATSSRALAIDLAGVPVGRGAAGGGNPNSHPPQVAADRVASAIADAVAEDDRAAVRHCVLGMAGESKFTDPDIVAIFNDTLRGIGIGCPITVVSDAEVAFASATAEPDGSVVIGGTGSVAARIVDRRKTSWVGGWGWLLGDEGSAFWIGREAVRVALRQLQGSGDLGQLSDAVLTEALGESARTFATDQQRRRRAVNRLITAANAEAPIRLARFASLVSANAGTDPAAKQIVADAADLLATHVRAVREVGERTPVVLAGSVIGPDSPFGTTLREQLTAEVSPSVLFAPDGTLGAAWLAAIEVLGPSAPRPGMH